MSDIWSEMMDIYVCPLKQKLFTSLIFLSFVSLFYRSEQLVLKWKYKGSLGNLVSPPLFIWGTKLLNLRQSWGNENLTYERESVTEKDRFPYKGGG